MSVDAWPRIPMSTLLNSFSSLGMSRLVLRLTRSSSISIIPARSLSGLSSQMLMLIIVPRSFATLFFSMFLVLNPSITRMQLIPFLTRSMPSVDLIRLVVLQGFIDGSGLFQDAGADDVTGALTNGTTCAPHMGAHSTQHPLALVSPNINCFRCWHLRSYRVLP